MLELLVPPEPEQLRRIGSDRYDAELRPGLMTAAIEELSTVGIAPDLWKLEGLEDPAQSEAVAIATRRHRRDAVGCLVLGRGADRDSVDRWIRAAAGVEGFVGFAIGRSIWWEAARRFLEAGGTDDARRVAVETIAAEYGRFVRVFEEAAA